MEQGVIVYIDLEGDLMRVGKLWVHDRGGRESMTFEYERSWLNHPKRFILDEVRGRQEITFT